MKSCGHHAARSSETARSAVRRLAQRRIDGESALHERVRLDVHWVEDRERLVDELDRPLVVRAEPGS
jgi:hypothetical protein